MLINRREKLGIKKSKSIYWLLTNDHVYANLEDFNLTQKRRVLIVFDDMIADMEFNKKLSPIIPELFLRGRKLNIWLFFFKVPKTVRTIRLNATHYFIMQIHSKRQLQQIASNHPSDIDFKEFMELYKDYT